MDGGCGRYPWKEEGGELGSLERAGSVLDLIPYTESRDLPQQLRTALAIFRLSEPKAELCRVGDSNERYRDGDGGWRIEVDDPCLPPGPHGDWMTVPLWIT